MDLDSHKVLRMDFRNLISCIQCYKDTKSLEVILETLRTIIDICSNESYGKDALREEGGLDFLFEFLTNTDSTLLLQHFLKTLAFVIDENIHSQRHMTKRSVFEVLQAILRKETFYSLIYKNVLLLISAIMYQNNSAQTLICETGIIQDLLNMYDSIFPNLSMTSGYAVSSLEDSSTELWLTLNSALCFAVNNPQNEKNQEICSVLFRPSLRILETSLNHAVISSVCSFLSLAISNNARSQDSFAECDGLLTLKRCFQKHFDSLILEVKECNSIIGKGTLQTLNNTVGIISSAATNHEKNADVLGKLGVLSLMAKLLFIDILDVQLRTKLILSLGHCVDACCSNKSYVLETESFDVLLKKNLEMGHEELSSACKYLLQACLLDEGHRSIEEGSNDEIATLDQRNITDFSSMKYELGNKHFQVEVPDFENLPCKNNLRRSNSNLTRSKLNQHFDKQCKFELQDKDCKTKRSNNLTSRATEKSSTNLHHIYSFHSAHISNTNRQHLSPSVQDFKSVPSKIDCISADCNTPKIKSHFCGFSSKSNVSKKRVLVDFPKKNVKMHCTHEFDGLQTSASSVTPHIESFVSQTTPKRFVDFYGKLEDINKSLNQSFSCVSNSEKDTLKLNRNSIKSPLRNVLTSDEAIIDSFKFARKTVLSDRTNTEPTETRLSKNPNLNLHPYVSEKSYFTNSDTSLSKDSSIFTLRLPPAQTKSSMIQNSASSFLFPEPSKEVDTVSSITSCYEGSKKPLHQCSKLKNSNNASEHSKTLNDFGKHIDIFDQPNISESQSARKNIGRKQLSSFTTSCKGNKSMALDQTFDYNNYMKVIVFPGETCEDHGLISSFEMLRVVSIDDEDAP